MTDIRKVKERSEVPGSMKWDLSRLYGSTEEWGSDLNVLEAKVPDLGRFKGRLSTSKTVIAECLRSQDDLSRALGKLYTWAHLKHDEDLNDTIYQALHDKAVNLMTRVGTETSYMVPELLSMPKEDLESLLKDPDLEFARVPLRSIIRQKDHYLSKEEERLLAMAAESLEASSKTYRMLNDADLRFPSVVDDKGAEVEISHGRFISLLMSRDRRVRREAFERFYSVYVSHRNTFAAVLEGEMKQRSFVSSARNYPSALHASLDEDEVGPEIYNGLIDAVRGSLDAFHRYVGIRKRSLGLDELHMYDVYVPLVEELDRTFEWEEACELVISGLEPLGSDYIELVKEGLSSNWIDVLENRGKRSGAYSSGCYDSPPYILMNYQENIKELFTLAHEMGHSIHSLLSHRSQPHITADYRIFVAEVASTLNESLLMERLLNEWGTRKEQAFLVNHHLDSFKGTVFRQTMFAEFERDISDMVERNIPLTPALLTDHYLKLNRDHFGPEMVMDPEIGLEWARIPHFYYDFYVYKYATSFSVANAISSRLLSGDKEQLGRYLGMLSAGGSKPPLDLLRDAGVDLSTPAPITEALRVFTDLVQRFDDLL